MLEFQCPSWPPLTQIRFDVICVNVRFWLLFIECQPQKYSLNAGRAIYNKHLFSPLPAVSQRVLFCTCCVLASPSITISSILIEASYNLVMIDIHSICIFWQYKTSFQPQCEVLHTFLTPYLCVYRPLCWLHPSRKTLWVWRCHGGMWI